MKIIHKFLWLFFCPHVYDFVSTCISNYCIIDKACVFWQISGNIPLHNFRSRMAVYIRNNPVVRMFNEKIRGQSSVNLDQLKSSPSLGYGKVISFSQNNNSQVDAIDVWCYYSIVFWTWLFLLHRFIMIIIAVVGLWVPFHL